MELRVRDDGGGAADVTPGMGLSGMAERAEASGGRFLFYRPAGGGFESVMELPVDAVVTA